jgi:two-component system, NarL family, sensor histidine kinase UhpB
VRKLSRRSTLERVVTVNAGVVLFGAVFGTVLVRHLPHLHLGIVVGVYFLVMMSVMVAANYLVLRNAFRPLLEFGHTMASISRPARDQALPAEEMPDPDFRTVVESFSAMLDRMALESRAYSTRVFQSIEDERRRIGRELHDDTSQSLAAALLSLDMAEKTVEPDSETFAQVAGARGILHHCLGQLRLLVYDLRPSMLDDFGLAPAVHWYVDTHLQASGLRVVTDIDGVEERLPPDLETAVYRIVQESLSNVVRHAHATRAILHINTTPEHVSLSVSDNGIGFDPAAVARASSGHAGIGLLSIRERVEALDGSVTVYSVRDRGTQIQVFIPLPAEARNA